MVMKFLGCVVEYLVREIFIDSGRKVKWFCRISPEIPSTEVSELLKECVYVHTHMLVCMIMFSH